MMMTKLPITLLVLLFMPVLAFSAPKNDSHMEWWRDARFGMFIHWGLYSVQGGEWKGKDYGKEQGGASAEWLMNSAKIPKEEYRNTLAPKFNPTKFDAAKWVSTAKQTGMKYMVITSKHRDGFSNYHTKRIDVSQSDKGLSVKVASSDRDIPVTVIELTLDQVLSPGTMVGRNR